MRPLRGEDLPDVVALRQQVFRFSERDSPDRLAHYLEQIFFRHPWADEELTSLVYEDERGRVAGFLGIIPRPLRFQGEPVRAAVATQLMVAPERRGLIGRRLMRTFLTGPQDLSLSDTANEVGRRLWESLGGSVSTIHSLAWSRTLRPCRHLAARIARGPVLRAGLYAARPVLAAADALAARLPRSFTQDVPPGAIEALDAGTMAARLPQLAGSALRPEYEDGSLTWLLAQAAEKRQFGELLGALVRDAAGEVAGWFLYYCHTGGGLGEVLQLAARRSTQALVLRHLWRDAWRRGLTAIAGRVEPAFVDELAAHGSRFGREGPWMLIHSPRVELLQAITGGDAFLSRLEGEWWLSF